MGGLCVFFLFVFSIRGHKRSVPPSVIDEIDECTLSDGGTRFSFGGTRFSF